MKLRFWLVGAVVGAALLQASAVYAYKTEVIVKAENKSDFTAVVAAVHQQMQPGGRYEFVDKGEREKVDANFADMQSLFDKYDTTAQMDASAKVQLFNDQEAVNAILTHRDDKRLVCESVAPLGSHIPKTTCRTYREIEQEHRDTQNFQQQMRQVNTPVGGKG
ncbi:hypothetical protein [Rhodanobacter sp. C05]|uniref:hypothetical protein n=1 Tax=Rhodanobacter sp. C05 TaxID=1945855 RepID=UPI0009855BD1|nr:hypothetical protein [Rhodanobacter sp. C05]OOG36388.1 hypothetical protein B0E51_18785 [Rhodanobacter sp. C05]